MYVTTPIQNSQIITYLRVPMALLNGLALRDTSGVNVPDPCTWSSAARSKESMLSVLSDICQADPCLSAERGVAHTNTDK